MRKARKKERSIRRKEREKERKKKKNRAFGFTVSMRLDTVKCYETATFIVCIT